MQDSGHHEVDEFGGSPSIHSMMLLRPCLTVGSVSLGLNVWPSPLPMSLSFWTLCLSLWTAADLSPAWRCHFNAGDSFLVLFIHGGGFTVDRDGGVWAVPSSRQAHVLVVLEHCSSISFHLTVTVWVFFKTDTTMGRKDILEASATFFKRFRWIYANIKKSTIIQTCAPNACLKIVCLINPGWKETFH